MKNQYKNIKDLASLSNDAIDSHKNFKTILDKRTEHIQKNIATRKRLLKVGISAAVISAIVAGIIFWQDLTVQKTKVNTLDINKLENAIPPNEAQKLKLPIAENSSQEKPHPEPQSTTQIETAINKEDIDKEPSNTSDKQAFKMGYEKAYPSVGMDSLSNYFNHNLQYPEEVDRNEEVEGTVNVVFTITEEGEPSKIEIQNSLGKPFDEECIRLISDMPRWKPAMRNGKAVNSKVSIQLSFTIEK